MRSMETLVGTNVGVFKCTCFKRKPLKERCQRRPSTPSKAARSSRCQDKRIDARQHSPGGSDDLQNQIANEFMYFNLSFEDPRSGIGASSRNTSTCVAPPTTAQGAGPQCWDPLLEPDTLWHVGVGS